MCIQVSGFAYGSVVARVQVRLVFWFGHVIHYWTTGFIHCFVVFYVIYLYLWLNRVGLKHARMKEKIGRDKEIEIYSKIN